MSEPTPTTPIAVAPVPPPPAPEPSLWQSCVYLAHALGRLPIAHVAAGCGSGVGGLVGLVWRNSPNIAGTLVIVALGWFLAAQRGCTLPVIPWVGPGPVQPTALEQEIRNAYAQDADADKATSAARLSTVLAGVVTAAKAKGATTAKEVADYAHSATLNMVDGAGVTTATKLLKTRAAVGAYLATQLPTAATAPADASYWTQATKAYADVAAALKGVK